MKIRDGFVSNSSSSSFVLNKRCITDIDYVEFKRMWDDADPYDHIGETPNYFFGVVDYSETFCHWLENKKFTDIEWG